MTLEVWGCTSWGYTKMTFSQWRALHGQVFLLIACPSCFVHQLIRYTPALPSRESASVLLITTIKGIASNPGQATILSSSKEPETKSEEELVWHDLEIVQLSGLGLWVQGSGSGPLPPFGHLSVSDITLNPLNKGHLAKTYFCAVHFSTLYNNFKINCVLTNGRFKWGKTH